MFYFAVKLHALLLPQLDAQPLTTRLQVLAELSQGSLELPANHVDALLNLLAEMLARLATHPQVRLGCWQVQECRCDAAS